MATIDIPLGFMLLNPYPLDIRSKVENLTDNEVKKDPTYYVGYAAIYDEDTSGLYYVSGGNATDGWEFSQVGGGTLAENVTVTGVGTVGGYTEGNVIANGTSFTEFVKGLLVKRVAAVYHAPVISLSATPSTLQEVGTEPLVTLRPNFVQRDAGGLTEVRFYVDGTLEHTQSTLAPYQRAEYGDTPGSVNYSVQIDYAQGPIKQDNLGDDSPNGRIEAGTKTGTASVTFQLYNWYGASDVADGDAVRSLTHTFSDTPELNTGTTSLVMTVAVPNGKAITEVVDIDASNTDLTSVYVIDDTITSVPDADGLPHAYKVYKYTNASPYLSNHRHQITIE